MLFCMHGVLRRHVLLPQPTYKQHRRGQLSASCFSARYASFLRATVFLLPKLALSSTRFIYIHSQSTGLHTYQSYTALFCAALFVAWPHKQQHKRREVCIMGTSSAVK